MAAQAMYALVHEEKNQLRTFCALGCKRSIGPFCFFLCALPTRSLALRALAEALRVLAVLFAFVLILEALVVPEAPAILEALAILEAPALSFLVFFKINPV